MKLRFLKLGTVLTYAFNAHITGVREGEFRNKLICKFSNWESAQRYEREKNIQVEIYTNRMNKKKSKERNAKSVLSSVQIGEVEKEENKN